MIGHKPKMERSKSVNFTVPTVSETTKKRKVGRPTVMTSEVIAKLESAFSIGANSLEACAFAQISPNSLYDYEKIHPEFRERKEQLRKRPILAAKNTIAEYAQKDPRTAQWLLEKRCKEEYGQVVKIEAEANISNRHTLSIEQIKKIKSKLESLKNG